MLQNKKIVWAGRMSPTMPVVGPGCSLTRGLNVKLSLDAPAGFTVSLRSRGCALCMMALEDVGVSDVIVGSSLAGLRQTQTAKDLMRRFRDNEF